MKSLLIGSRALGYWNPNVKFNDNTDWDIISDRPIEGAEWHDPNMLDNYEFEYFTRNNETVNFNGHKLHVVTPIGLSIIKRSHLWRNLSFQKHITHYHKNMMGVIRQTYSNTAEQLLQYRIKLTMQAFPQGHPSLAKTVDEFFDDYVTKKYDHDYLHELVAFYEKPLYTRLQKDSTKAWCDKDLWYTLSLDDQTKCVAEEAYVIAIERFMVPKDWEYPSKHAFIKALDKVCTTLCSGWFRDHAIDYYPQVVNLYSSEKFDTVKKELTNG